MKTGKGSWNRLCGYIPTWEWIFVPFLVLVLRVPKLRTKALLKRGGFTEQLFASSPAGSCPKNQGGFPFGFKFLECKK